MIVDIVMYIKDASDPFDYQAFQAAGGSMPIGDYAQRLGLVLMSFKEYPDMDPHQAYRRLIDRMNEEFNKTVNTQKVPNCCGGGRER